MSQSLGSLGDSLGLTVMSVYAFSVVQLPVMFVATINYPQARVDLFTTEARVVPATNGSGLNGTVVDLGDPTVTRYVHGQPVSFAFLGVSALCAVFATVTVYLRDKGVDDSAHSGMAGGVCGEEFTTANPELITSPTITMWNSVFLWLVVAGHALVAAVVCSPASLHAVALFAVLVYVSMSGILQPKVQTDGTSNVSSYVSSAYMGWGLMYAAAMMLVAGSIPYDPRAARIQLVAAVAFVDCFLLIFGHTWDSAPTIHTIMNCRLLYTVVWGALNIALYIMCGGVAGTQFVGAVAPQP